jgi:hypothetical protein
MKKTRRVCTTLIGLALSAGALWPDSAQAGAWVLEPGKTSVQLALMRQQTQERYFLDGERIPYFFEGESRTAAIYLDARRGFWKRLEGNLQVPFFEQAFDDLADERSTTGIGDVRLGLRYNPIQGPVVATVGGGSSSRPETSRMTRSSCPWERASGTSISHWSWPGLCGRGRGT